MNYFQEIRNFLLIIILSYKNVNMHELWVNFSQLNMNAILFLSFKHNLVMYSGTESTITK